MNETVRLLKTVPNAAAEAADSLTVAPAATRKNPPLAPWRETTSLTVITFALLVLSIAFAAPARADETRPTTDDPHAHLRQILDRPPFQAWRLREKQAEGGDWPDLGPGKDIHWFDSLGKVIGDFFDWLFGGSSRPTPYTGSSGGSALPGMLKTLMWVVIAVGLTFVLVMIVKSLSRPAVTTATARVLSRQQIRDAMESGDALALGTGAWLSEADRLAAEQDFRAVYRALYLALLSGLHTAGKIEHSPNRTNWTYVDRYRGPADERRVFGDLTGVFDRVWYGRQVAAGDDLGSLRSKVAGLTQAKPQIKAGV